ncbi:MAG: hypothetical protein IJW48_01965 [Clostridia bacterium]|nr:hypothetical protein [Clostridia bacterium]
MKTANLKLKVLFYSVGMLLCTLPPLLAILSFFPLWIGGESVKIASGFTLLLCLLAHVPLIKFVKRILSSGASYSMWLIMFLCFFVLENIAYEMTVISFAGFIGNLLGAVFFKLAARYGGRNEEQL